MTRHLVVLLALPLFVGCATTAGDSPALNDGLQHEATCYGIDSKGDARLDIDQAKEGLASDVAGFVVKKEGISWTARDGQKMTMNGLLFKEIKKVDTFSEDGELFVRLHFANASREAMRLRFSDTLAAQKAANALWYLCAEKQGLPTKPEVGLGPQKG